MPAFRKLLSGPPLIAIAITAVSVLWVGSGVLAGDEPTREKPAAEIQIAGAENGRDNAIEVRVRTITAEARRGRRIFSGVSEAERNILLRSEVEGEVEEFLAGEGNAVAEGESIVRLTAQDRPAALADARARLEQARSDAAAAERLFDEGFRSETQLKAARSALTAGQAGLERAQLNVRRLVIDAPFAGVLERYEVEIGDYVQPGNEVVRLLDLDPLILAFSVGEDDLRTVRLGSEIEARLSSGGKVAGEVVYISRVANTQTRSFRIEARAPNPKLEHPAGVTARISLDLPVEQLHNIPPVSFVLSAEGVLGVFGVNAADTVVFHPVEVIEQNSTGAWVSGLPESVDIIVVGQGWVQSGQAVVPVVDATPL